MLEYLKNHFTRTSLFILIVIIIAMSVAMKIAQLSYENLSIKYNQAVEDKEIQYQQIVQLQKVIDQERKSSDISLDQTKILNESLSRLYSHNNILRGQLQNAKNDIITNNVITTKWVRFISSSTEVNTTELRTFSKSTKRVN